MKMVLEACQPIGIEASLQAFSGSCSEQEQKRRALELALERARYEAGRAQRQSDAVDPTNRLVAAELEARWNAALVRVIEAEARIHAGHESPASLDGSQRSRLLTLGSGLHAAWNDPVAPVDLKKRILRTVIKEIVADVNRTSGNIEMRIHWAGGVHTVLNMHKNRSGRNSNATDKNVAGLVRELATTQPDSHIAATLNRLGYHTGPGNSWNETRVKNLRLYNQIPVFVKGAVRPWVTMEEAADELKVGAGVIRTMIKHGILAARQIAKNAPWMIQREELIRFEVQNCAKAARAGKAAPRGDNNQTLMPYL